MRDLVTSANMADCMSRAWAVYRDPDILGIAEIKVNCANDIPRKRKQTHFRAHVLSLTD